MQKQAQRYQKFQHSTVTNWYKKKNSHICKSETKSKFPKKCSSAGWNNTLEALKRSNEQQLSQLDNDAERQRAQNHLSQQCVAPEQSSATMQPAQHLLHRGTACWGCVTSETSQIGRWTEWSKLLQDKGMAPCRHASSHRPAVRVEETKTEIFEPFPSPFEKSELAPLLWHSSCFGFSEPETPAVKPNMMDMIWLLSAKIRFWRMTS